MKYFSRIWVCMALIIPFVNLPAQDNDGAAAGNAAYRVVKGSNGQSFLLCSAPGTTVYTDIYFRMGPVYEFDSVSGISLLLTRMIDSYISTEIKKSGMQIKYHSTVEPEQICFHFESEITDLAYIMGLADDKIDHDSFDQEGLDEAKTVMRADLDSCNADQAFVNKRRIMKLLWGKDYKKLNIYGDQHTYAGIQLADVQAFYTKYFLPFNNTVSVTGTFADGKLLDLMRDAFKDFKSKEFNPELITRVIDFKPVINTIQLIAPTTGRNKVAVIWQQPGARQDRSATYNAYLLTQLINDPTGNIQIDLAAAGLKKVKAAYTCYNFYGQMEISAEPTGDNFTAAFAALTRVINDFSQKNYFKEGEIEKAQKNIAIEFNNLRSGSPEEFMDMVNRFRFSNDENYFSAMTDSINGVSVGSMRRYVGDYFTDHLGIRCLYTSDTVMSDTTPGERYFALDPSVADITFHYDLNKTDVETPDAKLDLQRLIEWLKINPDVHVQINGFADEGEFKKAYDDTIKRFIDSTYTFHKAMPDAYKKGYLRIELMRAMKIAKAIYEAGITEDRITGTSMVFTSETKEAAAANRKCTVTLDKIKPRMSLYEYHFGKKKEETQN